MWTCNCRFTLAAAGQLHSTERSTHERRLPNPLVASSLSMSQRWQMAQRIGRVRKQGDRFYIDLRRHGRIYSIPSDMGRDPFKSREAAEIILNYIRGQVAGGLSVDLAIDFFVPTGASKASRLWLDYYADRTESCARRGRPTRRSLVTVDSCWRNHIEPALGDLSVHQIRRAELKDWVRWLRGKRKKNGEPLADSTVQACVAHLMAFLHWLEAEEILHSVPVPPTIEVRPPDPDLLTREEQDLVLEAIPEPRRGIFIALVDLALRPSEARAVMVGDFDPAGLWLRIRRAAKDHRTDGVVAHMKTAASVMPVTARLAAWIESYGPRIGYLFPSPQSERWGASGLAYEWRRASGKALPRGRYVPLRDATRKSTATAWRESGADWPDIQQALRHRDVATSQLYAKGRPSNLRRLIPTEKTNGDDRNA